MHKRASRSMIKNAFAITAILAAVAALIIGRLVYLQLINADEYKQKAQMQQLSDTAISAQRGTIYDTNMNPIAKSATAFVVYLVPNSIVSEETAQKENIKATDVDLIVNGLAEILDYDEEETAKLREKAEEKTNYIVVEKKVENPVKEEISKFIAKNKFNKIIGLTQSTKRYYPFNNFASTVLGFTGGDDQGLAGIEAYYENQLKGVPGRIITAKDALSNALPDSYESAYDAKNGSSLVLTIDQSIQYYLEKSMEQTVIDYDAKGAYGVVMDPQTGAVLAMSTKPDYDLNNPWLIDYEKTRNALSEITDEKEREKVQGEALQQQWRNRVVSDIYIPGSVFKLFVASAALEEQAFTTQSTYTCTGSIQVEDRIIKCHKREGHGTQTFEQGLENSCNPFFITAGLRLGSAKFYKYFEAFGFTEKTGIDLPGEAAPFYKKQSELTNVSLASASFGQTNSLTPIQVATALCAIANGGNLVEPYVVREVLDSNNSVVSKTETKVKRQVISEETSKTMLSMMESVVNVGTGKNAYVAGYHVGGKTGTSEKLGEYKEGERKKYVASFAAVAPADNPRLVLLIIIDEPNQDLGGGALAAPIAAEIIELALKNMGVEPRYTDEEAAKLNVQVPNVVGTAVAAAQNTIQNSGFGCKIIGDGDTVIKQSPVESTVIPSGGIVVLYTSEAEKADVVTVPDFTNMTVTQANAAAATAGINISLTGTKLTSADIIAYKQSEEAGSQVETGKVVKVYFKHVSGVSDLEE